MNGSGPELDGDGEMSGGAAILRHGRHREEGAGTREEVQTTPRATSTPTNERPSGAAAPVTRTVELSKQLDFAKDSVTQVLSLSTAILALSLTFSHNWVADAEGANTLWLKVSWVAFVSAITIGLWALLALTGLAYAGRADVFTWSFRAPWLLEIVCFLIGVASLLVFGWQTVTS